MFYLLFFDANHPAFMILILFLMLTVASQNVVKKKSRDLKLSFVYLSLFIVETLTQSVMLGLHIIPATPRYIIPVSGMIM